MHSDDPVLPDGSSFFIATIGPRQPGLLNFLQRRPNGSTRRWFYFWLNYKTGRDFGESRWRSLRWAMMVS